jgi:alkylation response protein AidB-like acyl-CoA dehydrogenase
MDFHLAAEHKAIQNICRQLATDFVARAARHDRDNSLPLENYAALKQAGFYGLTVPKELGGQGAGLLGWSIAGEELAQGCPATALTFNMHVISQATVYDDPIFPREVKEKVGWALPTTI